MIDVTTDLRTMFGPVRDQGDRPTCLAFAISDTHAALRPNWSPLSSEFLFYHAQRLSGRSSDEGCTLPDALRVLRTDGQPNEDSWPYLTAAEVAKAWAPPRNVGQLFRRDGGPTTDAIDRLVQHLDADEPVLILLKLSGGFFRAAANRPITFDRRDLPNEAIRHAVVSVAHGWHESGRCILVRNSWGSAWADGGHAWVTEAYLQRAMLRYAVLKGDADGARRLAAA